jgi:hypothetical protein
MAGLLGDSWEDPRTQATLQLAAGLLGGGNFGQALGRGLEGYQGTMSAAKRQAMIDEEMTRRKQEREAEQAQLAAKQAEALRIENVVRGSLMPVSGSRAIGQDAGGPTQAKAALIGQAPKLDANALLAQGVPYERVKALFEAQNLGRDEVARTAEIEGPNGQKIIQGFNKWGGRAGEGVSGYVAPQLVNQGDRQTFVKPSAGVSLGVGMSPAERDAAARGWAGVSQGAERLNLERQKQQADYGDGGYSSKPLPAAALKMQGEAIDALGASASINKTLNQKLQQIEKGELKFGLTGNLINKGMNVAGMSTQESRNFASFMSDLERMRNESLRLNSGVQTEGDAQRAWNELFQNVNDTALVRQRISEIQALNNRAAQLQKLKVDSVRSNYNARPFDFSQIEGGENKSTAGGFKIISVK